MLQHKEESGSSGGVGFLALQNEFTKIFIYNFLEVFCWEGDEFYANKCFQIQGPVGVEETKSFWKSRNGGWKEKWVNFFKRIS